ncbi:MAG: SDR family oxidoreductase [Planctomycetota bacterium]|nr:SDR family oxidoreductase [Planctomycetota bacterium]
MIQPASLTPPSVWITGGAGFIGRALTKSLTQQGVTVVRVDHRRVHDGFDGFECTFDDLESALVLSRLSEARTVVHLAGHVGVRHVVRDPAAVGQKNSGLTLQLLRVLERLPLDLRPRLFAASTSEVYLPKPGPLSERDPVRSGDERGRWSYAASKIASERRFDEAHTGGLGPVHLRFFNVVGPGQDSAQGMMLPTFVEHALAGRALPVHGDGSSVRTLAHVDDVAETLASLVMKDDVPAGPLNIGGTARASVLEIARCVLALSHSRSGIVHVDPKQVVGPAFEDIAWREPDLARLAALDIPVPKRSLEAIVRDTLDRHTDSSREDDACASRAF